MPGARQMRSTQLQELPLPQDLAPPSGGPGASAAAAVSMRRFVPVAADGAAAAGAAAGGETAAEAAAAAAAAAEAGGGSDVSGWQRLAWRVRATLHAAALLCVLCVLRVLRPLVLALLRSLVRSRDFWVRGLGQAWYDKTKLTDKVSVGDIGTYPLSLSPHEACMDKAWCIRVEPSQTR